MKIDHSGGIPFEAEYPLLTPSSNHRLGENNGFWFFSDDGRLALHLHIETVDPEVIRVSPAMIDLRREFVMVMRNDNGQIAHDWIIGQRTTARGPGGANCSTECVEPFEHWAMRYHGAPYRSSSAEMLAGLVEDRTMFQMAVDYELQLTAVAPPWIQGGIGRDPRAMMTSDVGRLTGGFRYEQLMRAEGYCFIDGERFSFSGSGIRTHRRGDRGMVNLNGHNWQLGIFPSGMGFGLQSLFNPDGSVTFEEAMVTDGKRIVPAKILEMAKLTHLRPEDEEVGFVLESEFGRMEVTGRNGKAVSSRTMLKGDYRAKTERWGVDARIPRNLILTQTGAKYHWNGEETYGLNERSAEIEQIEL